jgi:hypothetical protein
MARSRLAHRDRLKVQDLPDLPRPQKPSVVRTILAGMLAVGQVLVTIGYIVSIIAAFTS